MGTPLRIGVGAAGLLSLVVLVSPRGASEELGSLRGKGDDPVPPAEWAEVPRAEVIPILEMLALQTRANYEKIHTWRGTYSVRKRVVLEPTQVADIVTSKVDGRVIKDLRYLLDFALDVSSDSIYRWKKASELAWIEETSQQQLDAPDTISRNLRSVVTPEEYVHYTPEYAYPAFQVLPDHPEARQKRAAFRDPLNPRETDHRADFLHPCKFYGYDVQTKFWERLETQVEVLQGERDEESRQLLEDRLHVYQASGPHGTWYQVDLRIRGFYGDDGLMRIVWSPAAGFNPISHAMWGEGLGKMPMSFTEWEFRQVDGIYVPWRVKESGYDAGELRSERECVLQECVLNEPIDPSQFSYRGLGLADGDLLMDRVERICYIIRSGEAEKLAHFGEKYVPPEESGVSGSGARWAFTAISIVGLAVVVLLVLRTRRARASTDTSIG